jgi:hypothetical protein
MKRYLVAIGVIATLASYVSAETSSSILRSLPTEVQKDIERTRAGCRESNDRQFTSGLTGDDGLRIFTVSGTQAVMVDELNFCGGECNHGVNCATGFTHNVDIYVRSGSTWTKAFSKYVTEPVFLSTEYGKFKALVLKVPAWDKECPSTSSDPTEWKRRSCDFVVRWDNGSKRFTYRPL